MAHSWWKHGTIYQIYPRSFADSNGDGVGDLPGITARLDYLADLGVDALWLSPFYPSPMADFGYDVSDYTGVHELFGTLDDFDALVAQAHRLGIRVVIDWVPNHSSDLHPWFVESRSSRDHPRRDWYVWRDPAPGGGPPNNWSAAFRRVGKAWTFDEATGQYYLHSFMAQQPDLNWENPAVRAAMHDTLRFWLDRGVDGFRIDVAHKLGKAPDLGDNPADVDESTAYDAARRRDEDWASGHDYMREIRAVVDGYDDRMLVGEVYLLDHRRLVAYVNTGDELHLAHNFLFVHQPWKAAAFRAVIAEWHELASERAWPAWFLNNHDHSRVVTRFDDGGKGPARARVAAMLLLTLRGTPFLFQGEELGLPDAVIAPERVVDVDDRDPERAPIPWEPPSVAGPGAGFTTGMPWLPITAEAERLNIASQSSDGRSMLALYRYLLGLRRASDALRAGDLTLVDVGEDLLAYSRRAERDAMFVALNFSSAPAKVSLPAPGTMVASTDSDRPLTTQKGTIRLGGEEGVVVRMR